MTSRDDNSTKAEELFEMLDREARESGYNLNPDSELTLMLCEGLVTNIERYGYPACPCRLASGIREEDLDIICPCDYRDADLAEHGACFCALYVSDEIVSGKKEAGPIPERRPDEDELVEMRKAKASGQAGSSLWRCRVCGYLCASENPPGKCPICKADSDRFEPFSLHKTAPVWRCKVCGYLSAMDKPPGKCPICKADSDRFEEYTYIL